MALLPFEDLYAQHAEFVGAAAKRLGVPIAAVPDVVQETFMLAHAELHTLECAGLARRWLETIVTEVSAQHRRQSKPKRQALDVDQLTDPTRAPTPADLLERSERLRRLSSMLAAIKPAKREVFILFELEQLSCPEIAAALRIPLNTVYSRLHRARDAFGLARAAIPETRVTSRHAKRTHGSLTPLF